jgi:6-phosphogluconolactonase
MRLVPSRRGRLFEWLAPVLAGAICLGLFGGAGVAAAQPPAFAPVTGSPFATGGFPYSVAFSPIGGLLATANNSSSNVSVFSVAADGALSPVSGSPFATPGSFPYSVAFSPSGGLLATANLGSNSVSVFSVAANGALTPVVGSPFATAPGSSPQSVAFSPSGGLLATANYGTHNVSVFSVEAGGQLSGRVDTPAGLNPNSVAFSPSGGLLATANYSSSNVSVFSVAANGALSPVTGSPFATGAIPFSVAFSPSGGLLATAIYSSSSVSVFTVDPGGQLSGRVDTPAGGSRPWSVAFSPSGELLATANNSSSNVSVFSVDPGGALTPVTGSPFATGGSGPASVAFSPIGELLAASNLFSANVSVFAPSGPLEIAKTADRGAVRPGKVLSYTITLRPAGPAGGGGQVMDDLSGVLDKASYQNDAHATRGTVAFDAAAKQLVWTGTLAPTEDATITYSVKIHQSADGLVSNEVDGPPGSSCASSRSQQTPCITETPIVEPPARGADLALTKTASTATVHPGGQVTFALAVRNDGPRDATGVTVQDPIPSGLFIQSAQPSQGTCTLTADELVCRLGTVLSGGQALVSVTATVAGNASGTLVNEGSVYGDQEDPVPGNNTARSAVTVTPLPNPNPEPGPQPISDLVVTKHVNRRTVRVGQKLTYTITVTNAGPNAASDVRVVDGSRRPLKVLSVHPAQGSCTSGRPIRCSLGTLAGHAHTTITIKAIAQVAGVQVNAAAVMSGSWDPAVRSNLALARTTILRVVKRPAPPPPRVTG